MVDRKIIYEKKNLDILVMGGSKQFGVAKYLTPICFELNTWLYRI